MRLFPGKLYRIKYEAWLGKKHESFNGRGLLYKIKEDTLMLFLGKGDKFYKKGFLSYVPYYFLIDTEIFVFEKYYTTTLRGKFEKAIS